MSKKGGSGERERPDFNVIEILESAASWKRGLTVVFFLLLVLCVFMPELCFQNKIFLVPDTKAPLSFAAIGKESLESGTYPLWNPYLFCGMPSYPSLAYTPYVYPLSFVTHVLHSYLRFPESIWLLFHYLLAGVGVYLLTRSLRIGAAVALLAGATFMLMPNFIAVGANGHGSQACAIAYMPFALLFGRNIFRGRRRVLMTVLLAVALGFQMLRGHVQISYYTFLLIGLLYIFESIHLLRKGESRSVLINFIFTAVALAAAIGIASVLIFPVREYASLSIRGGGGSGGLDYGYATSWSLHPKEIWTFVFPWAYGFGKMTYWGSMPFTDFPNYLGIVTVVFSILAIPFVRHRWKWFLIVAAVLSTMISFGKHLPVLYDPLFKFLPFFNKFRVPVMILIVQQLALVVLMAMGLDRVLRMHGDEAEARRLDANKMKWIMIALSVVLIIILASSGSIKDSIMDNTALQNRVRGNWLEFGAGEFTGDLAKTVVLLLVVAVALFLFLLKKLKLSHFVIVIAVISLLDLFIVNRPILHPEKGWKADELKIIRSAGERRQFMEPDAIARFLGNDGSLFRIFPVPAVPFGQWSHSVSPFSENKYMISKIFSMGGYHAAKLRNYQDVMDVMFESFNAGVFPIKILNMLNVKYVVFPAEYHRRYEGYQVSRLKGILESSGFLPVWKKGNNFVYENPQALPRAFLVDAVKVVSREEALRSLTMKEFDPSREVLLEKEPDARPVSIEGSSVRIASYNINSITMEAHIEKPCMMVLGEIAYPDWKAEVDGQEREILTANYCLRAISLSPGDKNIVFRFSSGILSFSLIVSIVTFALAILVPVLHERLFERRE